MKRAQKKALDESERPEKKGRLVITPLAKDPFGSAMRAACVRPGGLPLPNQPLIVNALDSGCWLSEQVAYWPANEAIGRRVYDALLLEDGEHHDTDGDPTIHLLRAFIAFDHFEKRLCKLLKVSSLDELGVLRHVDRSGDPRKLKNHVKVELLDTREFRLDVQY